jgi:elongation factor Tu
MWQAYRAVTIAVLAGVALLPTAACKKGPRPVSVIAIGHEDHGKATLAAAISRVDSNDRGGTFTAYDQLLGAGSPPTIRYRSAIATYEHTVCRTNDECTEALNAKRYDGAIVVVSGVDGPMPQTNEQLRLAWSKGLRQIVIFINKIDMQDDPELIGLVERECLELAQHVGFDPHEVKVIRGSARHALAGTGGSTGQHAIRQLLQAMDTHFSRAEMQ